MLLAIAIILFLIGLSLNLLILVLLFPKERPRNLKFVYHVGRPTKKGVIPMLAVECSNIQKIKITVNPVIEVPGQPPIPAQLQGSVVVEVQEGEATFEMVDDRSFWIISQDVLDETPMTLFKVKGDADLGEGIVELVDFVQLTVSPAMATSLGLTAEVPVPK